MSNEESENNTSLTAEEIKRHDSTVSGMEREIAQLRAKVHGLSSALTLDRYQTKALDTAVYPGRGTGDVIARAYVGHKLAGECGEVNEHLGKALRDDNGAITDDRRAKLRLEIGDVLWYVAALASELGLTLSDIADANLAKLAKRKAAGTLKGSGSDR